MKKTITLLIILLTLPISNALTINIESAETIIQGSENLTINYELSLDESAITNYSITLYNEDYEYTVLNNSEEVSELSNTIEYNTTSMMAGSYALELKVNNPSITINKKSGEEVVITQQLSYQAIISEVIYVT